MKHSDTCPACGDTFDDTASQLRPVWSDRHDNIVCLTCFETTDTDPTPPHGTPRPLTEETVFFSPCETYKVTVRKNPARVGWEVITYDATTGEIAELPNVTTTAHILPFAFYCYEVALAVAFGIEDAWLASYHAYCVETPLAPLVSRGVVYGSDDCPSAFGGALDR